MNTRTVRKDLNFLNAVINALNTYKATTDLKKNKSSRFEDVKKIAVAVYQYAGMDELDVAQILSDNVQLPDVDNLDKNNIENAPEQFSGLVQKIKDILSSMKTGIGHSSLRNSIRNLINHDEVKIHRKLIKLVVEKRMEENKKAPIFSPPEEVLCHVFTFFSPIENKKLQSVCRKFYAISRDERVLQEQIKGYFSLSDEAWQDELKANHGSIKAAHARVEQKHGRAFFMISTSGRTAIQKLNSLKLAELFKERELFSSKEEICQTIWNSYGKAFARGVNPSFHGDYYIIELQLPLIKAHRLIKEEKQFEQLASCIKNAFYHQVIGNIVRAPVAVTYRDNKFFEKETAVAQPSHSRRLG